jgi:iron(III) transport system ATP-binding protein
MEPRVLLLDEPFSNLDAKLREQMRLELKDLQTKTGITIIFVTHDQYEAMVLSDRIVVMNGGVIQQVGKPRDIYDQPKNQFIANFIGAASFLGVVRNEQGVFLPDDMSRPLPIPLPGSEPRGRGRIMIRPEDVVLSREGGSVRAKVVQQMFIGDAVLYLLDLHGQRLEVKHKGAEEYSVGDEVSVTIKRAHLFALN